MKTTEILICLMLLIFSQWGYSISKQIREKRDASGLTQMDREWNKLY